MCVTCGVQYGPDHDTAACPICRDERQYIGRGVQRWTDTDRLREGHSNRIAREVGGLWAVGTEPEFGIGQRALIVPGEDAQGRPANLLWDCVPLVDDETVERVEELGGLAAIAISHPHYYSAMREWSAAFGDIPIHIHRDDAHWVPIDDPVIHLWSGDRREILPGRTLINLRVHFDGGTVLHFPGVDGCGAICAGDIVQVVKDRRWVSFMYSYPNLIPAHPDIVRRAAAMLSPYEFDLIYGAWWGAVVDGDGAGAVQRSAERYLHHLGMEL